MASRNRKTEKVTKKRSFLRKRFLKIPIWIWLVLLVIGFAGSSDDNNATVPSTEPVPVVETTVSIAPEYTVEDTVNVEPTNIHSTNEPTATPVITSTPVPADTPVPTDDPTQYVLKQGDKNEDVRQLQKRLIALGYLSGSADGDFGSKTEKAVIAFQEAAGLSATGECDYYTYKCLVAENAPAAPKTATPKSEINSDESGTAYIGNKNSKKFHETWCKSVDDMKDSNKVSLSSRSDAISKGYEPCKNCDP